LPVQSTAAPGGAGAGADHIGGWWLEWPRRENECRRAPPTGKHPPRREPRFWSRRLCDPIFRFRILFFCAVSLIVGGTFTGAAITRGGDGSSPIGMTNAWGHRRPGKRLPTREHRSGLVNCEPGGDAELSPQGEGCCSRPPAFEPTVGVVARCDQNSRRIQKWLSARTDKYRPIR
jgi:hypothetical protein